MSCILLLSPLKDCSKLVVSRFVVISGTPPAPTCVPGGPCIPGSPLSPLSPFSPLSPLSPFGPIAPGPDLKS